MTVVNGRKGRDTFAYVSGRGCSVVDYCIYSWQGGHWHNIRFQSDELVRGC